MYQVAKHIVHLISQFTRLHVVTVFLLLLLLLEMFKRMLTKTFYKWVSLIFLNFFRVINSVKNYENRD